MRARHTACVVAMITTAVLSGCSVAVDGHGTAAPNTAPSSSASGTTSSGTTSPGTTSPTQAEQDLATLLAPSPPGSHPWDTAWSRNTAPSLEQFVANAYPARSAAVVRSELKAQGLNAIAHRTWTASDGGNEADDILFRFDTPQGAQGRFSSATRSKAADRGEHSFDVPGYPKAIGYYNPTPDDIGDVRTIAYGLAGDIVVEVFFYSPGTLDKAGVIAALTDQLRLLPE